jgi:patatin-related protein
MAESHSYGKPKFDREVRLGLVAYSGISLAIYMNGVCHEFYRAVRGRGVYKLLKALVDADVIVDVVSGTSAGGINGVLLSYALTNSTAKQAIDFNLFGEVWRNSGDIQKLLHRPRHRSEGDQIDALLDGEGYYQQQLERAFAQSIEERRQPSEREWVSPSQELDLFVTGTDFQGRTYRTFDDLGAITEITDHSALFHLKHRQGRKEPFNPIGHPEFPALQPRDTFAALAKLCRLTSAMPVVFPMVRIDPFNHRDLVDRQLTSWGNLQCRPNSQRSDSPDGMLRQRAVSFIDGGLLDNAPFTPALRAMYYRPPNRPIQRVLFYIDPIPKSANNEWLRPNLPRLLQKAMLEIPMYQSVTQDLQAIREHNQKVERYQTLLAHAEETIADPRYTAAPDLQQNIYLRSRTIDLRDRLLPLMLRLPVGGDRGHGAGLERLARLLTHRQVTSAIEAGRERCLQAFAPQLPQLDVRYSLRQHFYLNSKIHAVLATPQRPMERFYLEALGQQVGRSIQLLETIQTVLEQLFSHPVVSDNFYQLLALAKPDGEVVAILYEYVFRLLRYLLDAQALPLLLPAEPRLAATATVALSESFINLPLQANEIASEWLPAKEISTLFHQLQEKISILTEAATHGRFLWNKQRFQYDRRGNQRFLSILTQIESATTILLHNAPAKASRQLLHQFQNFEQLDRLVYPFEYLTDLGEKSPIVTMRVGPDVAQMGLGKGKNARDKLAGNTLYAFGGFFKKSWRTNDLLWGRLDGLNRIWEGIVNPTTIVHFHGLVQRETQRLGIPSSDYLDFLVQEALPQATVSDRARIKGHLMFLMQPNLEISAEKLRPILNDIVLTGQREILKTDLEQVFRDADDQNRQWGITNSQALVFDSHRAQLLAMAQTITSSSLQNLSVAREQFFRQQYRVGSERLFANIPGMVLVNLTTRAVLVAKDLLLNFGSRQRADKVRQNLGYRVADRLLHNFYWWLQSQATKTVLQVSLQPFRFAGLVAIGFFSTLLTFALGGSVLIWLAIALGCLGLSYWQVRRRRSKKRLKFQKLLSLKAPVDRW